MTYYTLSPKKKELKLIVSDLFVLGTFADPQQLSQFASVR